MVYGSNQESVCRLCDGKGNYGHGEVDPAVNTEIPEQISFHLGNVSQLSSDRRGTALLIGIKGGKKRNTFHSFSEAVFSLIFEIRSLYEISLCAVLRVKLKF